MTKRTAAIIIPKCIVKLVEIIARAIEDNIKFSERFIFSFIKINYNFVF